MAVSLGRLSGKVAPIMGAEIPVDGGILNCGLAHVRRKIWRERSGKK
jgi:hypothetical protein